MKHETGESTKMPKNYVLRDATPQDAARIAPLLRSIDKVEIGSVSPLYPELAILRSILASPGCRIGETLEGVPICIWGVHKRNDSELRVGEIWLVGTPLVYEYSRAFLVESKNILKELEENYDLLYNYIHAENSLHIRWLQWLGFSFLKRHERFGLQGLPFYQFCKICS